MPLCFLSLEWEETDETPGGTQLAYDFIKNHLPTVCCQAHRPPEHIGLYHVFTSFCTAAMFMAPFVLREATLKESN